MVQSLLRAMEVLEAMKVPDKSFSLAELSDNLSLSPSTVHRLLQTLCTRNYAVRDEKTHMYKLGPALISLGIAATHNIQLQTASTAVLQKLSNLTKEDSFLIVLDGFKGLAINKVEGVNSLKVVEKFGSDIDLHCGAIRKSLLAFQPDAFIKKFIKNGLARHADNTITDPDKLAADLENIRRSGIAVSCGEYIKDAVGVGAPVFDRSGAAIASIGIIAPVSRIEAYNLSSIKRNVKQCAMELSYDIGYSESTAGMRGRL